MRNYILCGEVDLLDMELSYYIVTEDISRRHCDLESYGVKVVKTQCSEGGGRIQETKEIDNIFYRKSDAEKFVKLIMDNKVTPMTLHEVVEDYISDYFLKY